MESSLSQVDNLDKTNYLGSPQTFTYDPSSGRMTQWQSSNSAVNKSQTGTPNLERERHAASTDDFR